MKVLSQICVNNHRVARFGEMINLMQGDCLEVLKSLDDNSVDSVVTDPPYGLGFMGKKWDIGVPAVEVFVECLRVLKPGGHLLAFGGSRTYHRLAVAAEDAGFDIRDQIMWVYGCLDESTQVATSEGVKPYNKTSVGDTVLCYNTDTGEYSYQPILEIVEYEYNDTAYRLIGDFGEQVVSRNHRVIVERDGVEVFELAENLARQQQARVPILESLPELRQAVHDAQQGASGAEQDLLQGVCECADRQGELGRDATGSAQGQNDQLRGVRDGGMEAGRMASEGQRAHVQPRMQRQAARRPVENSCAQGPGKLGTGVRTGAQGPHDRPNQPGMEGRGDVPQQERCLCQPVDQVCEVPAGACEHGTQRRLCNAAPAGSGEGDREAVDADGVRPPHQPRCDGQPAGKPDAVQDERGTQGVRAWRGHRTAMVRVEPFRYVGKVWCLRVPTGAFVAVRNGVAFPTGNSGFPKSLNVGKAIDKAAGAEREVVGESDAVRPNAKNHTVVARGAFNGDPKITAPATEAAKQWDGWGTALKPAHEPIVVARKPLAKGNTVAANVLAYGTGALNIDGCRVATDDLAGKVYNNQNTGWKCTSAPSTVYGNTQGRWPANLIHDGSEEVVGLFPNNTSRFFYSPKASKKDRGEDNKHPTVKPTDLMRYLCRLVTPPGGVVLDPFMGSGSTGKAAKAEGFGFIGIELDPEYFAIAEKRIDKAKGEQE